MASPLTPAERTRLVGILGRLGSDFAGERAAAGLLASRLLATKGLTWCEILTGHEPRRAEPWPPQSRQQSFRDWRAEVRLCAANVHMLTEWEAGFVASLRDRHKPPTPKQLLVLAEVVAKVRDAQRSAGAP